MNIYTLGFIFGDVGRGCDPLQLMSLAFLYTTSTYTNTRLINSPLSIPSSYSVMYIYSSLSLSISPPYSLVVFVT